MKPEPPKRFFHHPGPESDAMRDRAMRELQKLSPEKRADLWRAVWTVLNLPPEKRQMLLGMDEERRRVAREEIDKISPSKVKLTNSAAAFFAVIVPTIPGENELPRRL